MTDQHPVFLLKLHKTYYQYGCFNVRLAFDNSVRKDAGPVSLVLQGGPEIRGHVYRTANPNGTARVFGYSPLRDWFQENYELGDTVPVVFESDKRIRLG